MLKRNTTQAKKYLLSLPLPLWDRLVLFCNNEWGNVARFIREAIQEKLDREAK